MKLLGRYEAERDVVHTVNCVYRDIDYISPHFHQSIEISYMLNGKTNFHIGSHCFAMEKGDITFVPEYYVHYAQGAAAPREKTKAAVLIVPKKYYEEFTAATGNATYFFLDDKRINERIGKLITELADGIDNMSELLIKAYTNMIFGLIARDYRPVKLEKTNNDLMLQIIRYIDEHYKDDLTLDVLANEFGYSKYYFSRLFNRNFSCNLSSYVNSVRARAVSENTDGSKKTEIIIKSGFNTLSSYYRSKR